MATDTEVDFEDTADIEFIDTSDIEWISSTGGAGSSQTSKVVIILNRRRGRV